MRPLAFVSLALVLLSGCLRGLAGGDEEAPVRIESIEARFEPGDRGELVLGIRVEEAAGQAARLTGIQWELWLGDRWFAAGTRRLDEPLPAKGEHAFTVSVPLAFRRALPASSGPTELVLGVRGGVTVQRDAAVWRWPFQARHRARVPNAPAVDDFKDP